MKTTEKRQLGSSDLKITTHGFGGAALGNLYEAFTDDVARDTVRAAYNSGMGLFDTAPFYGHGLSEHRIGEALRGLDRDSYVLSTKCGRLLEPVDPKVADGGHFKSILPFRQTYRYDYDGVMRSVEDSLQRLGMHRIDVLLVHDLDVGTHGSEEARLAQFDIFMNGGYRAMRRLRDDDTVRAIGGGVNEVDACFHLAREGDFDCFLLAGRYTLLEQGALDSFLPYCAENDISLMIGGPFNSGILATGAVEGAYYNYLPAPPEILQRVRRIEAVCKAHQVTMAAAALQFPLGHKQVASMIPGARSINEIAANQALMAEKIPEDLWVDLKSQGLMREDAPHPKPTA